MNGEVTFKLANWHMVDAVADQLPPNFREPAKVVVPTKEQRL
jgi:hypothetical protein